MKLWSRRSVSSFREQTTQDTSGLTGRMATREAPKTIVQPFHIRTLTNSCRDEHYPLLDFIPKASNSIHRNVLQIRVTTTQQVGPWLPKHILRPIRQQKSCCTCEPKTQQPRIQFPRFALPDPPFRGPCCCCRTRDKEEADEKDYHGGGSNRCDDENRC